MRLQVIETTSDFACGTFGPVAIAAWDGPGIARDAQTAAQMLRMMAASRDDILVLAILGSNAPPAPTEVREQISRSLRDLGPKLRAAAAVVEAQGFRGAAMRAALLGMSMVMRSGPPQKSYATVREAVAFLGEKGEGLREAALVEAVADLRTR